MLKKNSKRISKKNSFLESLRNNIRVEKPFPNHSFRVSDSTLLVLQEELFSGDEDRATKSVQCMMDISAELVVQFEECLLAHKKEILSWPGSHIKISIDVSPKSSEMTDGQVAMYEAFLENKQQVALYELAIVVTCQFFTLPQHFRTYRELLIRN